MLTVIDNVSVLNLDIGDVIETEDGDLSAIKEKEDMGHRYLTILFEDGSHLRVMEEDTVDVYGQEEVDISTW